MSSLCFAVEHLPPGRTRGFQHRTFCLDADLFSDFTQRQHEVRAQYLVHVHGNRAPHETTKAGLFDH